MTARSVVTPSVSARTTVHERTVGSGMLSSTSVCTIRPAGRSRGTHRRTTPRSSSGVTWAKCHRPPTRRSISQAVTSPWPAAPPLADVLGPGRSPRRPARRGAAKVRVMTSWCRRQVTVAAVGAGEVVSAHGYCSSSDDGCWASEVGVQAVEVGLPVAAVLVQPGVRVLQRGGRDPAQALLAVSALGDEAGPFEDGQVLGDGGEGHVEGLGQLADGGVALGEALEDGASRRVGQGGEGGTERSRVTCSLTIRFINQ